MTIPKSYEALAADLASEKIISKTLQGQKESYMMLADGRKVELDAALARDAALREELINKREEYNKIGDRYDAALKGKALAKEEAHEHLSVVVGQRSKIDTLQQRLTVAEQALSQVEGACDLAMSAIDADDRGANFVNIIQAIKDKAALKPAEEREGS